MKSNRSNFLAKVPIILFIGCVLVSITWASWKWLASRGLEFMELRPGMSLNAFKNTKTFNYCSEISQGAMEIALDRRAFECKNINVLTEVAYISFYKGRLHFVLSRFSQKHEIGTRKIPSTDVTDGIIGKFGGPTEIYSNYLDMTPNDYVISKCSLLGGCRGKLWIKSGHSAYLFTSDIISTSGVKEGAIELQIYENDLRDAYNKAKEDYENSKRKEKANSLGF